MTNLTRDPKGYYVALGIEEHADADAIKMAYRTKAKRLHPDFNPSPIAAKQFHRLHEAYEILSDPEARKTYDRHWKTTKKTGSKKSTEHSSETNNTKAHAAASAKNNKPKSANQEKSKTKPKTEPKTSTTTTPDQPAICKCGRVTAQPRYITFDLVWGRFTRIQHRNISGVFCRNCADRTAIRASLITWLAGWWAWPNGPKETVKALLSNMRGGQKPAERNAKLLMRQSRAFRARGEMELARNAAEQALIFASTPSLRRDVDSLLLSLSAYPSRTLKNRWAKPGWAVIAQILPLTIVIAAISMTATLNAPVSLSEMVKSVFETGDSTNRGVATTTNKDIAEEVIGRLLSVASVSADLHTGPGSNYQRVATLPKGDIVLATESDPNGEWIRVSTTDGATGFMSIEQLSVDVPIDALGVSDNSGGGSDRSGGEN